MRWGLEVPASQHTCQDHHSNSGVIPCISEAPRHLHDCNTHINQSIRACVKLSGFHCISRGAAANEPSNPLAHSPVLGVKAFRFSGRLIVICSQCTHQFKQPCCSATPAVTTVDYLGDAFFRLRVFDFFQTLLCYILDLSPIRWLS